MTDFDLTKPYYLPPMFRTKKEDKTADEMIQELSQKVEAFGERHPQLRIFTRPFTRLGLQGIPRLSSGEERGEEPLSNVHSVGALPPAGMVLPEYRKQMIQGALKGRKVSDLPPRFQRELKDTIETLPKAIPRKLMDRLKSIIFPEPGTTQYYGGIPGGGNVEIAPFGEHKLLGGSILLPSYDMEIIPVGNVPGTRRMLNRATGEIIEKPTMELFPKEVGSLPWLTTHELYGHPQAARMGAKTLESAARQMISDFKAGKFAFRGEAAEETIERVLGFLKLPQEVKENISANMLGSFEEGKVYEGVANYLTRSLLDDWGIKYSPADIFHYEGSPIQRAVQIALDQGRQIGNRRTLPTVARFVKFLSGTPASEEMGAKTEEGFGKLLTEASKQSLKFRPKTPNPHVPRFRGVQLKTPQIYTKEGVDWELNPLTGEVLENPISLGIKPVRKLEGKFGGNIPLEVHPTWGQMGKPRGSRLSTWEQAPEGGLVANVETFTNRTSPGHQLFEKLSDREKIDITQKLSGSGLGKNEMRYAQKWASDEFAKSYIDYLMGNPKFKAADPLVRHYIKKYHRLVNIRRSR